ncbi:hypothetical protein FQA39_LY18866 [Lamprigera yunnana]|nr:hypothetical protein FQA39_LY18866 [Lamprigera yunnana]
MMKKIGNGIGLKNLSMGSVSENVAGEAQHGKQSQAGTRFRQRSNDYAETEKEMAERMQPKKIINIGAGHASLASHPESYAADFRGGIFSVRDEEAKVSDQFWPQQGGNETEVPDMSIEVDNVDEIYDKWKKPGFKNCVLILRMKIGEWRRVFVKDAVWGRLAESVLRFKALSSDGHGLAFFRNKPLQVMGALKNRFINPNSHHLGFNNLWWERKVFQGNTIRTHSRLQRKTGLMEMNCHTGGYQLYLQQFYPVQDMESWSVIQQGIARL